MRQNSAINGMLVELRLEWEIFTWMRLVMKIGLSAINIPYTMLYVSHNLVIRRGTKAVRISRKDIETFSMCRKEKQTKKWMNNRLLLLHEFYYFRL